MKLINKISKNNLIAITIIISILGISYYFVLKNIAFNETKEEIYESYLNVSHLIQNGEIPNYPPFIEVIKLDSNIHEKKFLYESLLKDFEDGEFEKCYVFESYSKIGDVNYLITIKKLAIEDDELIYSIIYSLFILFVLIIASIFLTNYLISSRELRPFNKTLELLRSFSLQNPATPKFESNKIKEFSDLNYSLEILINRIIEDYRNLKEFTDNAAHELQTPLSIIRNKIEEMIQNESFDKHQMIQMLSIQKTVSRIIKLNKSLILLSRIESNKFGNVENLDLYRVLNNIIDSYEEIIKNKNIELEIDRIDDFRTIINPEIAEILLSNLILNAVQHSNSGSRIIVSVSNNEIIFSNSGEKSIKEADKIFDRFYKESKDNTSYGLGLAIVKKICENNNLKISYYFENNMHNFKIYR
jgi:signal transduction histidine kinase